MAAILHRSKAWGLERLESLAAIWAERMDLPLDRSRDYLLNVMNYDLTPDQLHGLETYHHKCRQHGLLPQSS